VALVLIWELWELLTDTVPRVMRGDHQLGDDGHLVHDDGQLDPYSPVPLYAQLAGRLRARIGRGDWRRLPGEESLASEYQCSRDTVRRALGELRAEGLIVSTRGRGTFVVPQQRRH
jgi:GntR family transcriptional regulator